MKDEQDLLAPLMRLAGRRAEIPPERAERVRVAVHAAWQESRRARLRNRIAVLTATSLAAGLAGIATVAGLRDRADERAPVIFADVERSLTDAWPSDAAVPIGVPVTATEGLALRTSAGVSLRLAAGARVVPLGPERVRLEQGRLYVDSAEVSGLVVEAAGTTVSDVGTQFEIDLLGPGPSFRVREGRILVEGRGGESWSVDAGEQLELRGDRAERSELAPDAAAWVWAEALAQPPVIEGEPLRPFLEWVARERGLRLSFDNPASDELSKELLLYGDVSELNVEQAVDVVLATTGFEAETRGGRLEVRSQD